MNDLGAGTSADQSPDTRGQNGPSGPPSAAELLLVDTKQGLTQFSGDAMM